MVWANNCFKVWFDIDWIMILAEVIDDLHKMQNKQTGKVTPMISDYHHGIIMKHADRLNSAIIYDRDFSYNYFGFKVCIFNFFYGEIDYNSNWPSVDPWEIILIENWWKTCWTSSTHFDESCCWHSWRRLGCCNWNLQSVVGKVVHSCLTNSFQCCHTSTPAIQVTMVLGHLSSPHIQSCQLIHTLPNVW